MAALQASSLLRPSSSSTSCRGMIKATLSAPRLRISPLSQSDLVEELNMRTSDCRIATSAATPLFEKEHYSTTFGRHSSTNASGSDPVVIAKLHAILEAVADRIEMHRNIGEQRDNWNHLLLTSINAMTLTAATMVGLAAMAATGAPLAALKISSTTLYLAAAGMLAIMNKLQPSQLVEEQRNASRLFKQLHGQIQTTLSIGNPTIAYVNETMEKVLAIDRAYPLPLLGVMIDKFPSTVEPAVWWPQQRQGGLGNKTEGNGWNGELEDEMRRIVGVIKTKDKADYLRLGRKALAVNKVLAISGPLLTCIGAVGSAFVGTVNPWAVTAGVVAGALASVVNAMEHGGQVGMVFEMYRSNAGFFELMEETIESNVNERVGRRENGEVLEMKVALQLGRSLSELKNLLAAASSSSSGNGETIHEEFASKLF